MVSNGALEALVDIIEHRSIMEKSSKSLNGDTINTRTEVILGTEEEVVGDALVLKCAWQPYSFPSFCLSI